MIDALVSGRLAGKPTERTSKNGNRFATAKVRVSSRDADTIWVSVITFSTTCVDALMALADGEAISLAGELTPKVYIDKTGTARPSLDLVAHAALSAYDVKRRRKASSSSTRAAASDDRSSNRPEPGPAAQRPLDDFDDDIAL
jgi:single-stranded DNA-binding protein